MRKQFKKIVSAVLSAAMVLTLSSGMNLKVASAVDEPAAGATETTDGETGFTAMVGFQTSDFDCRNSYDDNYYSIGQNYLSWLRQQNPDIDLTNVATYNGRDVYYNGNIPSMNKAGELKKPENVQLNTKAVVEDATMTADGEYTVKITNLNLKENPSDKDKAELDSEAFHMLFVAADIPLKDAAGNDINQNMKATASSVKIDGEEVATNILMPQKVDNSKHALFMIADGWSSTEGVAYPAIPEADRPADQAANPVTALNRIPQESIEITFSIEGVDWTTSRYQPKEEYKIPDPGATPGPSEAAPSVAPSAPSKPGVTLPATPVKLSKPFDIYVEANANSALSEKVGDPEIYASTFGSAALKAALTASGAYKATASTYYEVDTGCANITQTGEYKLTVTALGDCEDMTDEGAVWLPLALDTMPTDYNLVGNTITVGDKTYTWNAKLYPDGASKKPRMPVCNKYAENEPEKTNANPFSASKTMIPVKKGETITFDFYVTADAPEQPKPTVAPTAAPASNSYNAYLGFQTDNWLFRDPWNNAETGMKSKDYNYKSQIALSYDNKTSAINAKIKDAKIVQGTTKYDISISGVNLKTLKGNDAKAKAATMFKMLFISTDIPLTMKGVKCTDATLKLDGKEIKKYKTVPCKADANGYYQLMLANAYAPDDGTKDAEYQSGNELKILPTDSIEVSFSISGVNFDKTSVGPAKGKTFTKGAFKYKVTKESMKSAKTKKTSNGAVTVVGLSKKGKKAKKLSIPATLTQKKGKFKVTALKASALKSAKASSITVGKNIKKLPKNAFKNCKKLSKLTLKAKLSSVKKGAFSGCSKTISIKGTAKKQNLKKIKKVYKKVK